MTKYLLLSLVVSLAALAAQAQNLEIRTVNYGFGNIGVQVRNTSDVPVTRSFFITGITFGIKWSSRYAVDLAESSLSSIYNIQENGSRTAQDSFYYQAFSAGNTPYQLPEDWTQDEWIQIMSIRNTLTGVDTGTFRICEAGFSTTTDPNISINLIDFTPVINGEANAVVLPVSLLSFSATPASDGVRLSWATGSEVNSRGFYVQRSQSAAGAFASIGFVNSQGGSGGYRYQFTDVTAAGGVTYFYRLMQTGNDGSHHFSGLQSATAERAVKSIVQISPNPAADHITVLFAKEAPTQLVVLQVFDGRGRLISSRREEMTAGSRVQAPVAALPAGMYDLVVKKAGGSILQTVRFQKL